MKHSKIKGARRRRLAFTLVEMMVAMMAGSIVISGAYFLSGQSANNFNGQMSVAETQMALRMAMEQVRRDFSRAGFLAVRDSNTQNYGLPSCGVGSNLLEPVNPARVARNGSLAALGAVAGLGGILNVGATATTNLLRADTARLQGAYAAPVMFPVDEMAALANDVIGIDNTNTTFRMMFHDAQPGGGPGVYNPARFAQTFAPGRAVRFESGGQYFFRTITANGPNAAPPTVTLDAALIDTTCVSRTSAFVSVVSTIEYSMEPITDAGGTPADLQALVALDPGIAFARRAALVRREIDHRTNLPPGTVAAATTSVVLDYAVEFQVNAIIDNAAPFTAPVFATADGQTATATPTRLRSFIVTIAGRSSEGERTRAHLQRASLLSPMLTFVGTGLAAGETPYVSRVRTMRAEIFLPNAVP